MNKSDAYKPLLERAMTALKAPSGNRKGTFITKVEIEYPLSMEAGKIYLLNGVPVSTNMGRVV